MLSYRAIAVHREEAVNLVAKHSMAPSFALLATLLPVAPAWTTQAEVEEIEELVVLGARRAEPSVADSPARTSRTWVPPTWTI